MEEALIFEMAPPPQGSTSDPPESPSPDVWLMSKAKGVRYKEFRTAQKVKVRRIPVPRPRGGARHAQSCRTIVIAFILAALILRLLIPVVVHAAGPEYTEASVLLLERGNTAYGNPAKWRTVGSIPNGPSDLAITEGACGLARYAAICQELDEDARAVRKRFHEQMNDTAQDGTFEDSDAYTPFAVPWAGQDQKRCEHCGKKGKFKCTRCNFTYYCSEAHQAAHRAKHQKVCEQLDGVKLTRQMEEMLRWVGPVDSNDECAKDPFKTSAFDLRCLLEACKKFGQPGSFEEDDDDGLDMFDEDMNMITTGIDYRCLLAGGEKFDQPFGSFEDDGDDDLFGFGIDPYDEETIRSTFGMSKFELRSLNGGMYTMDQRYQGSCEDAMNAIDFCPDADDPRFW